ncbi:hypothetical protein Egran_02901 [Elaphomyces granulatus]|uniref:Major facilitator superfamily (MFS) profile domain-containing protein n=1 Tax=Elaphomyces granulatus TaxID=519963 RepID=A0A232LYU1_9EURO|nr:hypothetical protein Egran_02901 [Elaphomyces granulatus]
MVSLRHQHGQSDETLPKEGTNEQYHPQHSPDGPDPSDHDEMGKMEEGVDNNVGLSTSSTNAEAPEKDPNLVGWDGPDDPNNPQNWPRSKKWIVTMTLASMTVWITFATSVFSTATLVTAKEYGVSTEVMTLGTSLPLFGFGLGPLAFGPLSELYGRTIPLFFGYIAFVIFHIPVAVAQNVETILISRFLLGFFGCAPLAIVGGALADFWGPIDRAVAIGLFSTATFGGPAFGPILGGFIVQSYLGWRWTAWITVIGASFFGIIALFVVPESYAPVLHQRRAARLRLETRNWALHSSLDEYRPTFKDIAVKYLFRPIRMLFLEPILLLVTIYLSLIYGLLYLFFESYPISFQRDRGWTNEGVAGLPFLGILFGVLCGCALLIAITKTRFARKLREHGRVIPEERLPPMIITSFLLPIGLFMFAWTSNPHVSWVPQVIAGVPMGAGILVIFIQGLNYIIDVYLTFANSALAANTLMRSTVAGVFPLFAAQMFDKLGVNWAASLLGFLSAAMIPIPILFFIYGEKIRGMSKYSPKL